MKKIVSTLLLLLLFVAIASMQAATVSAATCTWTGLSGNNVGLGSASWSDSGNWSGCGGTGVPVDGDDLVFPVGASWTTNVDDIADLDLNSLSFTGAANYTIEGTETISVDSDITVVAGDVTFNVGSIVFNQDNAAIVAESAATVSFYNPLYLGTHSVTINVTNGTGAGVIVTAQIFGSSGSELHKISNGDFYLNPGDLSSQQFDIYVEEGSLLTDDSSSTFLPYYRVIDLAAGSHLYLRSTGATGAITGLGTVHISRSWHQIRYNGDHTFYGDITCSVNGACGATDQISILGQTVGTYTFDRSGGSLLYSGEINVNVGATVTMRQLSASALKVIVPSTVLNLDESTIPNLELGTGGGSGRLNVIGSNDSVVTTLTSLNNSVIATQVEGTSSYGKLYVDNTPSISANSTYAIFGSYTPAYGDLLTVITNFDGGLAVSQAFSNLAQGATIDLNGVPLQVDYQSALESEMRLTAVGGATPPPSAEPTPTGQESGGSGAEAHHDSAMPEAPACTQAKPAGVVDLFQLDLSHDKTSATLYFTPLSNPLSEYFISYGLGETTEQYGTKMENPPTEGVVSYTVNDLDPKERYSFKVRGGNGCMPGDWSNVRSTVVIPAGFPSTGGGFNSR